MEHRCYDCYAVLTPETSTRVLGDRVCLDEAACRARQLLKKTRAPTCKACGRSCAEGGIFKWTEDHAWMCAFPEACAGRARRDWTLNTSGRIAAIAAKPFPALPRLDAEGNRRTT